METTKSIRQFIQEEVQKLHKINLLESKQRQIEMKLKLLSEGQDVDSDLIEFEIPEWALSPLVNGDNSGLEDGDEQKLNQFVERVVSQFGNAHFMLRDIDGEDNLGFRPNNDIDNLGSNVYRLYIKPSNSLNETKEVEERKLTPAEKTEKEKIAKSLKPVSKWEKEYGDDGESIMYATATKMAKEKK